MHSRSGEILLQETRARRRGTGEKRFGCKRRRQRENTANKEEDLKRKISRVVVEKLQAVLIENDLRLREGPSGERADEGGGIFGVDGSRSG